MFIPVKLLAVFVIFALAGQGFAAEKAQSSSVFAGVYACAKITNDAERLACFDNAILKIKTAEASGKIVAVDSRQIQNLQREAFGFDLPSLPKLRIPSLLRRSSKNEKPKLSDISDVSISRGEVIAQTETGDVLKVMFAVERYKKKANGKIVFYLKNGQVWAQTKAEKVRIPRGLEGFTVEIRRAALGSYLLRVNGKGRAIRVRRTK